MLLQTRPDIALIAVAGLIVIVVWMAAEAQRIQEKAARGNMTDSDRRRFMDAVVGFIATVFLSAYLLPPALDEFANEACSLIVEEGEVYTIGSGETEEYCNATVDGRLNLNGTLDLSGEYA